MNQSPYIQERQHLINILNEIYPYGIKWFKSLKTQQLMALLHKYKKGRK
jgi:hypothetical protein